MIVFILNTGKVKKLFLSKVTLYLLTLFVCLFIFGHTHTAGGILVPQLGMEPAPTAMKVRSLNHWTVREFPIPFNFKRRRGK